MTKRTPKLFFPTAKYVAAESTRGWIMNERRSYSDGRPHKERLLWLAGMMVAVAAFAHWSANDVLTAPDDNRPAVLAFVRTKGSLHAARRDAGTTPLAVAVEARANVAQGVGGKARTGGVVTPASTMGGSRTEVSAKAPIAMLGGRRSLGTEVGSTLATHAGPSEDDVLLNSSSVPRKAIERADKTLSKTAGKIDAGAERVGDAEIASRMEEEFGSSAATLLALQQSTGAGMGDVVIALTLAGQTKGISAKHLLDLRAKGGSWGQIAAGLGFDLDATTSAVKAESRVALGQMKPDRQVAPIIRADATAVLRAQ